MDFRKVSPENMVSAALDFVFSENAYIKIGDEVAHLGYPFFMRVVAIEGNYATLSAQERGLPNIVLPLEELYDPALVSGVVLCMFTKLDA